MRAQQLALQQASYVKQQRQVAHLHSFIDRFRAKATKAKQAQSRIKALERMELIRRRACGQSVRVRVSARRRGRAPACPARARDAGLPNQAPGPRRCGLGHSRGRPHRTAGTQRRGQVDASESDRGHAGSIGRQQVDRAET
jgi:hypothetical protein